MTERVTRAESRMFVPLPMHVKSPMCAVRSTLTMLSLYLQTKNCHEA